MHKTVILDKGTFKRKFSALNKKEEEEIELVKEKFRKLRKQLHTEYHSVLDDSEEEEEFEMEMIEISDDSDSQ